LTNIYLNDLDRFVEDTLIPAYTRGDKRKYNPDYGRLCHQLAAARKREDLEEVRRLKSQRRELASVAPVDPDYRRLRYIRYADDFLLGFVGPKKEAEEVRDRLSEWLATNLKLTLSKEKTLVTHAGDDKAKFLGYEIKVTRAETLVGDNGKRHANGCIALLMPQSVVRKYRDRYSRNGKVIHKAELLSENEYTIVQRYQGVLRGIYNYYCMAVNVGTRRMHHLKWILETSLTKTLASKLRCKVSEIYRRYRTEILGLKALAVVHHRPDKEPLVAVFGGIPIKRIPEGLGGVFDFQFEQAWFAPVSKRSEVVTRLLAGECELCGRKDGPIHVHHIRKLSDIDRPGRRPKAVWEKIMSARMRKTLVVCEGCHATIHSGKYDGPAL